MYNFIITNVYIFYIIIKEFISYNLSINSFNDAIINICEKIVHLNVLYSKMVQWSVQDYFNIDDALIKYFYKFNSNVPYNEDDIDYKLLDDIEYTFKDKLTFDRIPINSGTAAIIFKGTFNEKPVVLKVLKKNILQKIEFGIENIKFLSYILSKLLLFFYNIKVNAIFLMNNNKKLLLNQCDFIQEVKNIEKFRSKHISNKNIVIPNVYTEFTKFNSNVIVMDYLNGNNINDVEEQKLIPYAEIIKRFILNSYLVFKEIHADMHAGNIILLEDSKVGVIDFGLTIEISSKQSNDIFNLFLSLTNTNIELLEKSLINLIINDTAIDKSRTENILKEALEIVKCDIYENKKISAQKLIKTFQVLIVNIDKNKNINKNISSILLSFISCIHILEKLDFDKRGFGVILSKHLKLKSIFD